MSKTRAKYRFTLTLPSIFTVRKLRDIKKRSIQYITIYKRVEAALAAGVITKVGEFRKTAQRGRRQAVYALANVEVTALTVEKSLGKGEFTPVAPVAQPVTA
jgi:hypothetical protein